MQPSTSERRVKSNAVASFCASAIALSLLAREAEAATLPIPCAAGTCKAPGLGTPGGFVTSGNASVAQTGNTLNVTQTSDRATLNWAQFNLSADGQINFQ